MAHARMLAQKFGKTLIVSMKNRIPSFEDELICAWRCLCVGIILCYQHVSVFSVCMRCKHMSSHGRMISVGQWSLVKTWRVSGHVTDRVFVDGVKK